jgi:hypothetical protein
MPEESMFFISTNEFAKLLNSEVTSLAFAWSISMNDFFGAALFLTVSSFDSVIGVVLITLSLENIFAPNSVVSALILLEAVIHVYAI